MSNRHQQLYLELLLIRTKYTDAEIQSALKLFPDDKEFKAFRQVALQVFSEVPRTKIPSRNRSVSESDDGSIDLFFETLNENSSFRDIRKLIDLAAKMGLSTEYRDRKTLISELQQAARITEKDKLRKILQRRRLSGQADQDYLDLAKGIMEPGKKSSGEI